MSPFLVELTLTLVQIAICSFCAYRAGFRKGVQVCATPDIDFLKDIQLPTSNEVKRQVESKL